MTVSAIGVQQILPQTGTGGEKPDPAPDRNNDTDSNPAMHGGGSAPASPGTGQIVDKNV